MKSFKNKNLENLEPGIFDKNYVSLDFSNNKIKKLPDNIFENLKPTLEDYISAII
jgi:hypothetical protein